MSRLTSFELELPQQLLKNISQLEKRRVAVVVARFNRGFTQKLENGAREELIRLGILPENIRIVLVPGSFEVPLAVQKALLSGYDAAVALGVVIRGETTHYEAVCNSVERALTTLQLQTQKPIGFGVIMVENEAQAFDRTGGHYGNKGAEAAQAALEMLGVLSQISQTTSSSLSHTV